MPRTRSAGLRDHLVAAADALLDASAPGVLTTRQIARQAAVSDGVLYNHFGDKDELLVAALVRRYGRLVEAFEARLRAAEVSTGERNAGGLYPWLHAYAAALRDLDAAALHLAAGLMADPRLLEAFWVEIHRAPLGLERLTEPLTARLRAECDRSILPVDADVGAAINLVFGAAAMSAITLRVAPHVDHAQLNAHLDASIDLVLAGLRGGPPPRR